MQKCNNRLLNLDQQNFQPWTMTKNVQKMQFFFPRKWELLIVSHKFRLPISKNTLSKFTRRAPFFRGYHAALDTTVSNKNKPSIKCSTPTVLHKPESAEKWNPLSLRSPQFKKHFCLVPPLTFAKPFFCLVPYEINLLKSRDFSEMKITSANCVRYLKPSVSRPEDAYGSVARKKTVKNFQTINANPEVVVINLALSEEKKNVKLCIPAASNEERRSSFHKKETLC